MQEKSSNTRNVIMTKYHLNCRLCHYAGFSNLCNFFQTGECTYHQMTREVKRHSEPIESNIEDNK